MRGTCEPRPALRAAGLLLLVLAAGPSSAGDAPALCPQTPAPAALFADCRLAAPAAPRDERSHIPGVLALAGLAAIPFDRQLTERLSPPGRPRVGPATETVMRLGDVYFVAPAVAGIYGLGIGGRRWHKSTGLALAAMINTGVITQSLKSLTGRVRPNGDQQAAAGTFTLRFTTNNDFASFPSGHTATAFTLARVCASRDNDMGWLYYGLATWVAGARVRKREHYVSDVLVGAAVGLYGAEAALAGRPATTVLQY